MSIESVGDLIQRARAEAASKTEANPGSERDRLMRVAQEFESMLMLQMLKEMRKTGSVMTKKRAKAASVLKPCSRRSTWSSPAIWPERRASGSGSR